MNVKRIIGQYHGQSGGPMLVFTAGIHGNEVLSVQALQEVFKTLEAEKPSMKGSIIGLAGNLKAIESEVRYIDQDLNRLWLIEENDPKVSEHREREELSEALSKLLAPHKGDVFIFDLHTTSSESSPFVMISDTLRNRELSRLIGVPIILGLLEHLIGMFIDATSRCGFPTVIFQGGSIGGKDTLLNHMGLIWKMLKSKCELDTTLVPESEAAINQLNSFGFPDKEHEFHEIIYSHKIKKDTEFEMKPGYLNLQSVKKKEVMATSNGRDIKALFNGLIFMPLYQKHGAEGFYIIRRIASVWIELSRKLRLFKHHDKLHWLLGVKKINENPLTYMVDEQITFMWAIEVFHLLGYIKVRQEGPFLYMTRREDATNPATGEEATADFSTKAYLRLELKKIKSEWRIPFSKKP